MSNILDDEKLKSILGMEIDDDEMLEDDTEPVDNFKQESAMDSAGSLTHDMVYRDLQSLITSGNNILATIQHTISTAPDDASLYTGASSLLNAIKDTMKEFTKVFLEEKRHRNNVELEQLKIDARTALLKKRYELESIDTSPTDFSGQGKVSYKQEDVIMLLANKERAKQD